MITIDTKESVHTFDNEAMTYVMVTRLLMTSRIDKEATDDVK